MKRAHVQQSLTPEQILGTLKVCGGDGHGLYPADAFPLLPKEWLAPLVCVHSSDGTLKGTLYNHRGKVVPYIHGVWSLELLRRMASTAGVTYRSALGRGTEAQRITEALYAAFKPSKEESNG